MQGFIQFIFDFIFTNPAEPATEVIYRQFFTHTKNSQPPYIDKFRGLSCGDIFPTSIVWVYEFGLVI